MIRVLHIAQKYGGNYPLFNDMVRMPPHEYESFFCYLKGSSDNGNEIDQLSRIVFYDFYKSHGSLFYKLRSAYSLSKFIDQYGIDVINCQREKTMPLGVMASLFSKKKPKVVVTVHGLVGGHDYSMRRKFKNYFYYRYLSRIVCISDTVKNHVVKNNIGNISTKVVRIHNGLDFDRFMTDTPREKAREHILSAEQRNYFCFGTVGRFSEVKNHENLLHAFKILSNKQPESLLLLLGDGPLKEKLFALADELCIANRVLFLGQRNDVADVLKALDVFVFPSFREGFGLALLEAMASGLPIIASDIPIFREIGGKAEIGRFADPHNPAALSEAMSFMMSMSQNQLRIMGKRARTRAAQNFSATRMIRNYELLYKQIVCE